MLKRSKGLKSKLIELNKFDITKFDSELVDQAKMIIPKIFKGVKKAKRIYKQEMETPPDGIKEVPKDFWNKVIEKAKKLGIGIIGFTPIDERFIFEEDFVGNLKELYENGIVLGMEMNYESIDAAPDPPAGLESLRIYAELGEATNSLTEFIRSNGYNAISCHPLGGPILYPAMAVKANLGQIGKQGLLITKEFGPRQRLSMIAINAGPLPDVNDKLFEIESFCEKCKRCIQLCPVQAIYEEPHANEDGTISRIDGDKCIEYFYETTGCSVCIKECPFHKVGYKAIYYSRL